MSSYDVVTITLNPAVDLTVDIPDFTAGAVNRVAGSRSAAGGKGVNVAAALADAGHRVAAAGFLGRDNAAIFEDLFRRREIADFMTRVSGATRFGIKISDATRSETTDINFPGLAPSEADISALLAQMDFLDAEWFLIAGSLPPGVPPMFYADLIARLKARGRRVALDASGKALRLALSSRPDMIKPNVHELESVLDTPLQSVAEVRNAACGLAALYGIPHVVVSMGEKGACFVRHGQVPGEAEDAARPDGTLTEPGGALRHSESALSCEALLAVPPRVRVLSTVGAGDAMVAGWLSSRLCDLSPEDTARRATAFSLDVLTHGHSGLSSADVVAEFAASVCVRPAGSAASIELPAV